MIENTPPSAENAPRPPPPRIKRWSRLVILAMFVIGLLIAGQWASQGLVEVAGLDLKAGINAHAQHAKIIAVFVFTILMIIPFMPAIEVSLALLAAFGPEVAFAIYAATVSALMVSFTIGRLVPVHWIELALKTLGLRQAEYFIHQIGPLEGEQRAQMVLELTPKRLVPTLLKHRYIAIAVILNVPGNAIIGGGGGIAMAAGMSHLLTVPRFLFAVAIATLPVPLAVWLLGGS